MNTFPMIGLLAVAACFAAAIDTATADTNLLQRHRQAVVTHDVENVSLSATVVGHPEPNAVQLTLTAKALAAANLGSLDLVTLVAGDQSLPVRLLRSSVATQFLADNVDPNRDTDAVAALIFDDTGQGTQTTLTAYSGSIADAINARNGMQLEIRVTRYRE